jgi:hypothetical protein
MIKKSKYGSKKTEYNGVIYDSKKEANRATQLDWLQKDHQISGLKRQVKFSWIETHQKDFVSDEVKFKRSYIADFVYFDHAIKKEVVEDAKGHLTAEYKKKKKIVEKLFNIKIFES